VSTALQCYFMSHLSQMYCSKVCVSQCFPLFHRFTIQSHFILQLTLAHRELVYFHCILYFQTHLITHANHHYIGFPLAFLATDTIQLHIL